MSCPIATNARTALATILCAGVAGAVQWREADAPTVTPVVGLSAAPIAGPLFASLRTPSAVPIQGAGSGWSDDDGATWRRAYAARTPELSSIQHHPSDPAVLWGANGAVWKSTDGGHRWTRVYATTNGVDAIAVDPANPDRLYGVGWVVVPGESFHTSVDGGITWTASEPVFFAVHNDVIVVPGPGPSAVLLAADSGIWRSTDGGATFASVLSGATARRFTVAAQDPRVVWCVVDGPGQVTWLRQSLDGGVTWSLATSPADDVTDLVAHPSDPDRAWAVGRASGAFGTSDGGLTWVPGAGVAPGAGLTSLVLAPTGASTLVAGGEGGHGGIWRSTDGGLRWERASAGPSTPIPDLCFDGAGGVYAVGLGVPLRRAAQAPPWEPLDYDGGATSTATSLSVHPGDPSTIAWLAESPEWWIFDRLQVSTDDGVTWQHVTPPPAMSSTWEVRQVAFDSEGTLYAGSQNGDLHRTTDLGAAWQTLDAPWALLRELVPDPLDPDRLHATDNGAYYRSSDRGITWTRHGIGPHAARLPVDLFVSSASSDELSVLAGQLEKQLYQSSNGGTSWIAVGAGLPAVGLTRLAVDPTRPARMLVGTAGAGAWLSLDGGSSFVPCDAGIENTAVVSIAFDPLAPGRAWLSCADGRLFVASF